MWHDNTRLGERQRENLRTLARGLRGPLPMEFHMADFCRLKDGPNLMQQGVYTQHQDAVEVVTECGTAACAAGYATIFVEPKQKDEDWDCYMVRVLGVDFASTAGVWMFGGSWASMDNTPEGAADRIDWLLDNGVEPANVWDQIRGKAPLCYKKTKGEV